MNPNAKVHTSIAMEFDIAAFPAVAAWADRMLACPAVARGVAIPDPLPALAGQRYPARKAAVA